MSFSIVVVTVRAVRLNFLLLVHHITPSEAEERARYALRNVMFPLMPSYDRSCTRYSLSCFICSAVNVCF